MDKIPENLEEYKKFRDGNPYKPSTFSDTLESKLGKGALAIGAGTAALAAGTLGVGVLGAEGSTKVVQAIAKSPEALSLAKKAFLDSPATKYAEKQAVSGIESIGKVFNKQRYQEMKAGAKRLGDDAVDYSKSAYEGMKNKFGNKWEDFKAWKNEPKVPEIKSPTSLAKDLGILAGGAAGAAYMAKEAGFFDKSEDETNSLIDNKGNQLTPVNLKKNISSSLINSNSDEGNINTNQYSKLGSDSFDGSTQTSSYSKTSLGETSVIGILEKIYQVVRESKIIQQMMGSQLQKLVQFAQSQFTSGNLKGATAEALTNESRDSNSNIFNNENSTSKVGHISTGSVLLGAGVAATASLLKGSDSNSQNNNSPTYSDRSKSYASGTGSAEKAIKFLIDKGWSKEQAAGIAANLHGESGFKVNAIGDGGSAIGIAQWHKDRQNIYEGLTGKKLENSTFEEQMWFVDWELRNGSFKKAGEKIKGSTSASDAAKLTEKYFEIDATTLAGGYSQERIDTANKFMNISDKDIEDSIKLEKPNKPISSGPRSNKKSLLELADKKQATPISYNNINKLTPESLYDLPNKIPELSDKGSYTISQSDEMLKSILVATIANKPIQSPIILPKQTVIAGIPSSRNQDTQQRIHQ